MNQLHPGVKWQFRLGVYILFFFMGLFIVPVSVLGAIEVFAPDSSSLIPWVPIIAVILLAYILFVLIVGEIFAHLAYTTWFYEFNDDGLRLERGIIWKRYSNIPYERIQNVDIRRGILARMLGFSTLLIQTAGYSAEPQAEGHIPAVGMDEAEQIREFVMKKVTRRK